MIIQNRDGSYEFCPLAPAVVRRLTALTGRLRAVVASARARQLPAFGGAARDVPGVQCAQRGC